MPKKLAIFTQFRLNSSRCKNKMIRKFGNSSLPEILMEKLNSSTFKDFDVYVAVYEEKLVKIVKKFSNLKIIYRNKTSANADKIEDVFNYLDEIDSEILCFINSCSPFLKKESIKNAINLYLKKNYIRSITTVLKKNTWFFDSKGIPLNDNSNVNTKALDPLFECTHNFHIFNKNFFLNNYKLWDNKVNDPFLFEVEFMESLDIDTEYEFKIYNKIFKAFK